MAGWKQDEWNRATGSKTIASRTILQPQIHGRKLMQGNNSFHCFMIRPTMLVVSTQAAKAWTVKRTRKTITSIAKDCKKCRKGILG